MRRAGRAYSNADIADAGGAHVGGGDSASATAAAAAAAAAASADYAQAFPCADIAMRTMFAPANGAAAAAAAAAADFAQAFPSADIAMPTRFAPAPGRPRACLRRRRLVGIEWLAGARAAKQCYPRAADGAAAASVRV